jgi:hypothetical protein
MSHLAAILVAAGSRYVKGRSQRLEAGFSSTAPRQVIYHPETFSLQEMFFPLCAFVFLCG